MHTYKLSIFFFSFLFSFLFLFFLSFFLSFSFFFFSSRVHMPTESKGKNFSDASSSALAVAVVGVVDCCWHAEWPSRVFPSAPPGTAPSFRVQHPSRSASHKSRMAIKREEKKEEKKRKKKKSRGIEDLTHISFRHHNPSRILHGAEYICT